MIVGATLDHHVHLHRRESGGGGGVDALQHLGHRKIDIVHAPEGGVIERIQAHRDAREPGRLERGGLACQQAAVGGECQLQAGNPGQHLDQMLDVTP